MARAEHPGGVRGGRGGPHGRAVRGLRAVPAVDAVRAARRSARPAPTLLEQAGPPTGAADPHVARST